MDKLYDEKKEFEYVKRFYLEHRFEFKDASPLYKALLSQFSIAYLKEWIKENKREG